MESLSPSKVFSTSRKRDQPNDSSIEITDVLPGKRQKTVHVGFRDISKKNVASIKRSGDRSTKIMIIDQSNSAKVGEKKNEVMLYSDCVKNSHLNLERQFSKVDCDFKIKDCSVKIEKLDNSLIENKNITKEKEQKSPVFRGVLGSALGQDTLCEVNRCKNKESVPANQFAFAKSTTQQGTSQNDHCSQEPISNIEIELPTELITNPTNEAESFIMQCQRLQMQTSKNKSRKIASDNKSDTVLKALSNVSRMAAKETKSTFSRRKYVLQKIPSPLQKGLSHPTRQTHHSTATTTQSADLPLKIESYYSLAAAIAPVRNQDSDEPAVEYVVDAGLITSVQPTDVVHHGEASVTPCCVKVLSVRSPQEETHTNPIVQSDHCQDENRIGSNDDSIMCSKIKALSDAPATAVQFTPDSGEHQTCTISMQSQQDAATSFCESEHSEVKATVEEICKDDTRDNNYHAKISKQKISAEETKKKVGLDEYVRQRLSETLKQSGSFRKTLQDDFDFFSDGGTDVLEHKLDDSIKDFNIMHASSAIKSIAGAHYIGMQEDPPRINLCKPLFTKEKTTQDDILELQEALKDRNNEKVAECLLQMKLVRKPVMNHILEESCHFLKDETPGSEINWSLPWEKKYKELTESLRGHIFNSLWCNKILHATKYAPVLVLMCLQIMLNTKSIITPSDLEEVLLKLSVVIHFLSDGLFGKEEMTKHDEDKSHETVQEQGDETAVRKDKSDSADGEEGERENVSVIEDANVPIISPPSMSSVVETDALGGNEMSEKNEDNDTACINDCDEDEIADSVLDETNKESVCRSDHQKTISRKETQEALCQSVWRKSYLEDHDYCLNDNKANAEGDNHVPVNLTINHKQMVTGIKRQKQKPRFARYSILKDPSVKCSMDKSNLKTTFIPANPNQCKSSNSSETSEQSESKIPDGSENVKDTLSIEKKMNNIMYWFKKTFTTQEDEQDTFSSNVERMVNEGKSLKKCYIVVGLEEKNCEEETDKVTCTYISGPVNMEKKMQRDLDDEKEDEEEIPLHRTTPGVFSDELKTIIEKDLRNELPQGEKRWCTLVSDISLFKVNIAPTRDPGLTVLMQKIKMEELKRYSEIFGHDLSKFVSTLGGNDEFTYPEVKLACPFCNFSFSHDDLRIVLHSFAHHFKIIHTAIKEGVNRKIYYETLQLFELKRLWIDNPCSTSLPQVFVCYKCRFACVFRREYYSHLLQHKDQESFFVCYKCEESYVSHEELFQHYKSVHDVDVDCPEPPTFHIIPPTLQVIPGTFHVIPQPKSTMIPNFVTSEPAFRNWSTKIEFLEEMIMKHPDVEEFCSTSDMSSPDTAEKFKQLKSRIKGVLSRRSNYKELNKAIEEKRKEKEEKEQRNLDKLKQKIELKEGLLKARMRRREVALEKHKERQQNKGKIRCVRCKVSFETLHDKIKHDYDVHIKQEETDEEEMKHRLLLVNKYCPDCDLSFSSKLNKMMHDIEIHKKSSASPQKHMPQKIKPPQRPKYTMSESRKKFYTMFGKNNKSITKWRQHIPEEMRKCDECDYSAIRPSEVLRHKINIHGTPYPYVCDKCGSKFISEMKLSSHPCGEALEAQLAEQKRIKKLPPEQRPNVKKFICYRCGKVMYGPHTSAYRNHIDNVNCMKDPHFVKKHQAQTRKRVQKKAINQTPHGNSNVNTASSRSEIDCTESVQQTDETHKNYTRHAAETIIAVSKLLTSSVETPDSSSKLRGGVSEIDSGIRKQGLDSADSSSSICKTDSVPSATFCHPSNVTYGLDTRTNIPLEEIASEAKSLTEINIPEGYGLAESGDGQYYMVPIDEEKKYSVANDNDFLDQSLPF